MRLSEAFMLEADRLEKVINLREYLELEKNKAQKLRQTFGLLGAAAELKTQPTVPSLAYVHGERFFRRHIYFDEGYRLVTGHGMRYLIKRNEEISIANIKSECLDGAVARMQLNIFDECKDHRSAWVQLKR